VSQLWIAKGKRSGLLTHTAATVNASLCAQMKILTAFVELESAIRIDLRLDNVGVVEAVLIDGCLF
jgi:hypothetical protein